MKKMSDLEIQQDLVEAGLHESLITEAIVAMYRAGNNIEGIIVQASPVENSFPTRTVFPVLRSENYLKRNQTFLPESEAKRIFLKYDRSVLIDALNNMDIRQQVVFATADDFFEWAEKNKLNAYYENSLKIRTAEQENIALLESSAREVQFQEVVSWETGLTFLKIVEKVDADTFKVLKECGLFYHTYDEEAEMRFTGWAFRENYNRVKLAQKGLKIVVK